MREKGITSPDKDIETIGGNVGAGFEEDGEREKGSKSKAFDVINVKNTKMKSLRDEGSKRLDDSNGRRIESQNFFLSPCFGPEGRKDFKSRVFGTEKVREIDSNPEGHLLSKNVDIFESKVDVGGDNHRFSRRHFDRKGNKTRSWKVVDFKHHDAV